MIKMQFSFRSWMKMFRSSVEMSMAQLPSDGWTRKQTDEARELVNQLADELVAKIAAISGPGDTVR